MQDLKQKGLSELFDMLAEQTTHYMKILTMGASKEQFEMSREIIREIQLEIESRKLQAKKTSDTRSK
jgi:hypothetical protein